jgi:putative ABC transport system permease protein
MLYNYFKIAIRNLWRNKVYTFINIFGFALGLAVCLLIFLYVGDELSYDRFHQNAHRIYRINSTIKFGAKEDRLAVAPDPMGPAAIKEIPEIQQMVRLREQGTRLVRKNDQNIKESRIIFADASLFEVFSFPMIAGNPKTALKNPKSVVITESIAKKYFNSIQVLGKTILINNRNSYKITGIIKDIPKNSHIQMDFFFPMVELDESREGNWLAHNFLTYLLLHPKAKKAEVEKKLKTFIYKYSYLQGKEVLGVKNVDDFEKAGNYLLYQLMPITAIHLYSDLNAELSANSSIQYVYIFTAVALLILLIACTNFMNLATAKSSNRAKEVGLRKVLGSHQSNLIIQFLSESMLLTVLSGLLSIAICELTLPYFNQLANKQLNLSDFSLITFVPLFLGFILLVGFLAGMYPAFYLSSFNPVVVLKGKFSKTAKGRHIRQGLVVLQFCISTILIICTLVIYQQLSYIQNKKLGFNKEQVLLLQDTHILGNQIQTFKQKILQIPEIQNASVSGYLPVPSARNDMPFFPEGQIEQEKAISMQHWRVDEDYIPTFGMEIVKGRNFSKEFATDSNTILLNESAAKLFGYANPIGKKITTFEDMNTGKTKEYKIIGIVRNFHFASLRENVGPLCLSLDKSTWAMNFRLKTNQIATTIQKIESVWKQVAPGEPFSFTFLDDSFNAMYRTEQQVGKVFISFAFLAIFLACLGLFGLAAYTTEQRTKEIGIRKVLGASVWNIIFLLSFNFIRLVLIGFAIATPIAWYVMNVWLQDFAYKAQISGWIFLGSGLMAFLIAFLTIAYQAIKASLSNPVDALRYE